MPVADRLDVVIISGDLPQEVLGKESREKGRLSLDGVPATLGVLRHYFRNGKDPRGALAALRAEGTPFVSLNGPYLAQYLEGRGFSVRLIPLLSACREELLELLRAKPRAVAISTTFLPFAKQIDAIAALVKQYAPETLVIAGGVQVWKSYQHRRCLEAGRITEDIRAAVCEHNYLMDETRPSPVDALVVSPRGEDTLAAILSALRDGADWRGLPNTAVFAKGRWRLNALAPAPGAETRVDWRRVSPAAPRVFYPVQAGHGCAFRCDFCDFCGLFPEARYRPLASLIEEIGSVPEHDGVRRVYFTDDNLFPTRKRVREVCAAIARAGLRLKWRGMFRISLVDEETAGLLAESGCFEVLLGIESGDPDLLRAMNKRTTPERIRAGIELFARHGIHTKSTFIVGYPGETEHTLCNTVELLNSYPTDLPAVHRFLFFTFAVLPLASVASAASRARHGLAGYGYHWRHATMDSEGAARLLAEVQAALKPELGPSYVLEVPEVPGLGVEQLKRVYYLRNLLAWDQQGRASPVPPAEAWRELEAIFLSGA